MGGKNVCPPDGGRIMVWRNFILTPGSGDFYDVNKYILLRDVS